jgi:gamma-glutamyltranspeptidase / glutathione hydrolase
MKISPFIAAMLALPCFTSSIMAQATPPLSACVGEGKAPACAAVRGDRADGWRAQSRAEVMAPHAMVTTSQPLAAQAGLQIMLRGGNAIGVSAAGGGAIDIAN